MKYILILALLMAVVLTGCSKETSQESICGTITAKYIRYNGFFIDVKTGAYTRSVNIGMLHYSDSLTNVGKSYCK